MEDPFLVLEKSSKQIVIWYSEGLPLKLALNKFNFLKHSIFSFYDSLLK